jgi:excisionase family DNA binding protein
MASWNELERIAAEIAGLREEVRQLPEALTAPPREPYLSTREVGDMFRVSYETVRRRVASGKWPALLIGRQARFGPEEISGHQGEPHKAGQDTGAQQLGATATQQADPRYVPGKRDHGRGHGAALFWSLRRCATLDSEENRDILTEIGGDSPC